ncbi:MAG: hypothetical protein AAF554_03935 [Bacteroidota bacterium]
MYREITNDSIHSYSQERTVSLELDTLDLRVRRFWKNLSTEEKKSFKLEFKESRIARQKDIAADTSNFTKIYYFGKKENVELKINGKFLKPERSLSEYHSESIYGDSIFKIRLGKIPRYSKVESTKMYLNNLRRTIELKIDPKYSLIEIEVSHIRSKTEILQSEKNLRHIQKKITKSDKPPKLPETIEVLEDEIVSVTHKIPKRNHSW